MSEPRDWNSPAYKKWRLAVYRRDRFKCKMPGCPGRDKRLNAHHLIRWADAPELRENIANGVTLCRTCHDRIQGQEEAYEAILRNTIGSNSTPSRSGGGSAAMDILFNRYKRPK